MKIIPFKTETDGDADLRLIGTFQGTKVKNKYPYYEVIAGYNPSTKEFIQDKCKCDCMAFKFNLDCKHLKTFKKVILKFPEVLE